MTSLTVLLLPEQTKEAKSENFDNLAMPLFKSKHIINSSIASNAQEKALNFNYFEYFFSPEKIRKKIIIIIAHTQTQVELKSVLILKLYKFGTLILNRLR